MRERIRGALGAALTALVTSVGASAQMTFTPLGFLPGGSLSTANDVSADGSVIIGVSDSSSTGQRAVRWTAATGWVNLYTLAPSPFNYSVGVGISANGLAASGTQNGGAAFRWTPGGVQFLTSSPPGLSMIAEGISADGQVLVGGVITPESTRAMRWSSATGMTNLGVLTGGAISAAYRCSDDGSAVVGYSGSLGGDRAFRWTQSSGLENLGALPGDTTSVGLDTSADGSVVVGYSSSLSGTQAFRWTQATGMTALAAPAGYSGGLADGVSPDGQVIVGCTFGGTAQVRAAIWTSAGAFDVATMLGSAVPAGWTLQRVEAISADGKTLVGYGRDSLNRQQAWAAKIPAPSEGAVLLAAGVMWWRRRR